MSIDESDPSTVPLLPDKYYERLPLWPKVDVVDKNIDGLIPSTRVESWEDFDKIVAHCLSEDGGNDFVFRGQHHYKWFLQSSLDRFETSAINKDLAHKHLHRFRLSVRGRVPDNSILLGGKELEDAEDVELWAVGQHHGLATPLLDWTRSPYVALFFAFEQEDHVDWLDANGIPNNHSRSVFILNETFLADLEADPQFPKIIEPSKDDHGRLVNQAGLFTIAAFGETLESSLLYALTQSQIDIDDPTEVAKYLCKVHIPNDADLRQGCLRWLRQMNIHQGSLFPDLIGASGYCNELTREMIAKQVKRKLAPQVFTEHLHQTIGFSDSLSVQPSDRSAITDAFLVTDELRAARPHGLDGVTKALIERIQESAGVDWFSRESELARLRTFIRRRLASINFAEQSIKAAAAAAVAKSAELEVAKLKAKAESNESDTVPSTNAE